MTETNKKKSNHSMVVVSKKGMYREEMTQQNKLVFSLLLGTVTPFYTNMICFVVFTPCRNFPLFTI